MNIVSKTKRAVAVLLIICTLLSLFPAGTASAVGDRVTIYVDIDVKMLRL